jgi:hypothetical protein
MRLHSKSLKILKGTFALSLLLGCVARGDDMTKPKPYILYLGADLSVERDGSLYPVQNVKGKSYVIEVNGKEVRVPLGANTALKEALKLTEVSATVADLKFKQTYTPENDPDLDLQHSASMSLAVITTGDQSQSGSTPSGTNAQNFISNSGPGKSMSSETAATSGEGMSAIATLGQQIASGSNGFDTSHSGGSAEGQFDAMDFSFEVSADHPLSDPYMIVVVRYHDPNGSKGGEFNWIHAGRLDPIAGKPAKVNFTGAGFTPGYQVESVQVHIYDRGEEIATNVAPKRMVLTRDQAFMLMTFDYVGSHKGATLPAAPALWTFTKDTRSRLPESLLGRTLYVKVSKDGNAGASFLDANCTRKIEEPGLDSALQEIHFNPALANGTPVDGVAEIKLGQQSM